ncbi:MAG: hypothetical protein LBE08_00030, partial [Bifidobacteriaceae bacterium]|nr:hypothetical protein [Bifidobacteriaceae bacterium]
MDSAASSHLPHSYGDRLARRRRPRTSAARSLSIGGSISGRPLRRERSPRGQAGRCGPRRRSRAAQDLHGRGAEANLLGTKGAKAITLGIGMTVFHTSDERIAVADLEG